MRRIGRTGDACTGHDDCPPRPADEGSPDVLLDDRPVLRRGDGLWVHGCRWHGLHGAEMAEGEPTVRVNDREIACAGHAVSCGGALAEGSATALAGRGPAANASAHPPIRFHLHVDADRDGEVDPDWRGNAIWDARRGAIVLVNCDDDDVPPKVVPSRDGAFVLKVQDGQPGTPDAEKPRRAVSAGDVPDLAPLVIRRDPETRGRPTAGWKAVLRASTPYKIRIFDRHAPGGTEIIGPGIRERTVGEHVVRLYSAKDSHELPDLDQEEYLFAMEGLQFPGLYHRAGKDPDPTTPHVFDGKVTLTLELYDPDGALAWSESAVVRIAPWLMFNHFDPTEVVYAVAIPDFNEAFIGDLRRILDGAGVPLCVIPYGNYQFTQDFAEIGYSVLPAPVEPCALPSVLSTWGSSFGAGLLSPGMGHTMAHSPRAVTSNLDKGGNIECSPPFRHRGTGEVYPFGRVLYGVPMNDGYSSIHFDAGAVGELPTGAVMPRFETRAFLREQRLQAPLEVDVGWLNVGHLDEILTFLPMKDARLGFRVLLASQRAALDALRDLPREIREKHPFFEGLPVPRDPFTRRKFTDGAMASIARVLAQTEQADPPPPIPAAYRFEDIAAFVEAKIAKVEALLRRELGLDDDDFVRLPILFKGEVPRAPEGEAPPMVSLTYFSPNLVNGLVVTKGEPRLDGGRSVHFIVAKPFGPKIGERGRPLAPGNDCLFEEVVRRRLGPAERTGVRVHFIDTFWEYHFRLGGAHCATQSLRRPPRDRFWWESWGA